MRNIFIVTINLAHTLSNIWLPLKWWSQWTVDPQYNPNTTIIITINNQMTGWRSAEWLLVTRTRLCQKYLSPLSWGLMCIFYILTVKCSAVAAERDAYGNICIRGTEINFHWRNWEGSERREEGLIDRSDRERLLITWISLGWGPGRRSAVKQRRGSDCWGEGCSGPG